MRNIVLLAGQVIYFAAAMKRAAWRREGGRVISVPVVPTSFPETSIGMATSKKGGASQKGKRMSQSEVLNHFAERFDLKRARVKEIFDELADLAAREVKRSEEFVLPGFGKLVLVKRQAREGRNPQTGEMIKIPAKTALKFRLSKGMKDTVAPSKKK